MSWQDRLRDIGQYQKDQKSREEAYRRESVEIESKWNAEKARQEAEKQRKIREIPQVLDRFRVRQLLEDVKSKVWKEGRVELVFEPTKHSLYPHITPTGNGACYVLFFKYQTASDTTFVPASGPSDSGGSYRYENTMLSLHTSLIVGVGVQKGDNSEFGHTLIVGDSEYAGNYDRIVATMGVGEPTAQEKFESALELSCRTRTKDHRLPLELQAQGQRKIEKVFGKGWFRR